jgi:RTA1 like protein
MIENSTNPSGGEHIIIGGLFVQIIFFGFFFITAVIFQIRVTRDPTHSSIELSRVTKKHMANLYITSILILIRSAVRVAEYLKGYDGYLMVHEVFIYVFDALPMFFVMVAMFYWHPSEMLCLLGRANKYFEHGFVVQKLAAPSSVEEVSDVTPKH